MRSGPIALRAAGAAVVLVLAPAAGTALAHDGVQVTATPSAPGADVDIRVQGCEGSTGTAKSPAFVADSELGGRDGGRLLSGAATVRTGLEDGTYQISVTCDGHDHPGLGALTVTRRPAADHQEQPAHRAAPATPVAPVRAGGGGTAAFAAPVAPGVAQTASEDGLGTPYTLLGLGMAGVAAVAVAFRSSRQRRAR
ncbi:hypothetical protein [Streptomyces sp. CC208A]|uniref:hypothetical protein n=1 Tax=Streptomyces sp. CC208A TaxID=3044573 RepID=UPI0024A88158|nr:hypothetical protein [Streptomyces sp. CC208A]